MRVFKPVRLNEDEFITLEYRMNQAFIRWVRNGILVVDRPAYGAEEKLLLMIAIPL